MCPAYIVVIIRNIFRNDFLLIPSKVGLADSLLRSRAEGGSDWPFRGAIGVQCTVHCALKACHMLSSMSSVTVFNVHCEHVLREHVWHAVTAA